MIGLLLLASSTACLHSVFGLIDYELVIGAIAYENLMGIVLSYNSYDVVASMIENDMLRMHLCGCLNYPQQFVGRLPEVESKSLMGSALRELKSSSFELPDYQSIGSPH